MKPRTLLLVAITFLPFWVNGQRVVTLDPAKDPIVSRSVDGTLQFIVPIQALTVSIQEALPFITGLQTTGIQKIGKSNYIIARGKELNKSENTITAAVLLVETERGKFQVDDLVISCSSSGECRECSLPPVCQCNKGAGNCGTNSISLIPLKKVTLTIYE